jgi:protein O-mannosyl-transferase
MKKDYQIWSFVCQILLLAGLIWGAFGNAVHHDFVWDDYDLIINNEQIRDLSQLENFFGKSFWSVTENPEAPSRRFYRPLTMLSYAVDYRLYGLNPQGFHLTNLLLHSLCAVILYFLGIELFKNQAVAFFATAIWAVHPTHVENVSWICGRGDILAGVFFFLSVLFFLKWLNRADRPWFLMWAAIVSYIPALFCKEMAVTLPVVFFMACLLPKNRERGFYKVSTALVVLLLLTLVWLQLRYLVLGGLAAENPGINTRDLLLSLPMVFSRYLGLVLGLVPIDPHHSETVSRSVWSLEFLSNLIVVMGYIAALLLAWLRRRQVLCFCLLWFPMTLGPVFMLGQFGDILYADRFLYIPSIGLIWACVGFLYGFIAVQGSIIKTLATGFFGLYLLMNVFYARTASTYWKDNVTLFSKAVQTSPNSGYIQFSLAKSLSDVEAFESALSAYEKAIDRVPAFGEAYSNKAYVLNQLGRHAEALAACQKAIVLRKTHHTTLVHMGDAFMGLGEIQSAENLYRASIEQQNNAIGQYRMGLCLMRQGKYDAAKNHLLKAIEKKDSPWVQVAFAELFLEKGDVNQAVLYTEQALERLKTDLPSNIKLEVHFILAQAFFEKRVFDKARHHLETAAKLYASGYGIPAKRPNIGNALKLIKEKILAETEKHEGRRK